MLINKKIHMDEFRLRILLTNKCDKKCFNCLNDFQPKGTDFIDLEFVKEYIQEYVIICKNKNMTPIISLSGGEPGLHPQFVQILYAAVWSGAKVQVNTNGLIDKHLFDHCSADIRYHMGHGLRNEPIPGQTAVFILSELYSVMDNINFIRPFYEAKMRIKTFVDYYASDYFRLNMYPKMLSILQDSFPTISGRHTGKQENRGSHCVGCTLSCVTLKALWLFPDNTSSSCPQKCSVINSKNSNVKENILNAYLGHKC